MKHTDIFATKEEVDKAMQLARTASQTPVIKFGGMDRPDISTIAWERAKKYCHKIALENGLPEIEGYYGMLADGEFVTMD